MEIGDVVTRRSHNYDIIFKVVGIENGTYNLLGIEYRLKVDAHADDLEHISRYRLLEIKKIFKEKIDKKLDFIIQERKQLLPSNAHLQPGKVLHIDADRQYLKLCLKYYDKLKVPVIGENVEEKDQAEKISEILCKHMPDILVITGHDSISKDGDKLELGNYKTSAYFIDSVRAARSVNPSKDSLVIIAGACQSYYERIMEAGANIASSPERIFIHALDPLIVAEKIAYTPIDTVLNTEEIIGRTITGKDGICGYQTRGTLRVGIKV